MRQAAASRCLGLPNVTILESDWAAAEGPYDLVTMVAVLHHLDLAEALRDVRQMLAPGGRFLAVGLAPPQSLVDHVWDVASIVSNPLIGDVKHPWPNKNRVDAAPSRPENPPCP